MTNIGTIVVICSIAFMNNLPNESSAQEKENRISVESSGTSGVLLASTNGLSGLDVNKFNMEEEQVVSVNKYMTTRMNMAPNVAEPQQMVYEAGLVGEAGLETGDSSDTESSDEDSTEDEEANLETTEDETLEEVEETVEEVEETVEETVEEVTPPVITMVDQSEALLEISNPQESYTGAIVQLSEADRDVLVHLVMGEAGNQGYEGACLVAQCIRDTMVYDGVQSVEQVRVNYKYSGKLNNTPNQNVLDAVSYIFDQGGVAVKHKIQYFYAPKHCAGGWHETQVFVIEHGEHRFFDKK